MSKRMKIKLHNFRIYLRKYVINSKYIVRNTLALIVMATFVAGMYGAGTLFSQIHKAKVVDGNETVAVDMYAEEEVEEVITINSASAPKMYADSCVVLSGEINENMGVEANELQLVAGVQDTQDTEEDAGIQSGSVNNPSTTAAPTTAAPAAQTPSTTQAPTTQAPTTQEPTTEAPTMEAAVTEAPTTELVAEEPTTEAPTSIAVANRGAISLSEEDILLMASVMTLECGGESYEGQLAVANVILTRYLSGYYGSTISDVVYSPYQFSVVSSSAWESALANPQASCIQAAREAASGVNNIGSYIYFRPSWNATPENYSSYTIIGNHVFF